MSIKLKAILDTTWIVLTETDERIGLLNYANDEYSLMIGNVREIFKTKDELNNHFDKDIFANVIIPEKKVKKDQFFIGNFPTNCSTAIETSKEDFNLPLFLKNEKSDIIYAAGYYCLNYPKQWMPAAQPKLSTLQAYKYLGPFKNEDDMNFALKKARKELDE